MLQNKTFYRQSNAKKNNNISPANQKNEKKQSRNRIKSIVKLPSFKNWSGLECKNYQLGQLLGEGAFSKVYFAKKMTNGEKCVIKIIEKCKISTQQRKKAFKRQMQALSLPKHKNLVSLIDQFQTAEVHGVVMQFFTTQSVSQFMKNNRPLQNFILQKIVKQICQGLMFLHCHGISHRDIKPQNVLINEHCQIKIIDFGFATNSQLSEVVIAGTPQYMAPELIARKNYNPLKADIWSFGIMIYWMALGYFPQQADPKNKNYLTKRSQSFNLYFPVDINPGLEYLLRKMLNPDPKERVELESILEDTWVKPKLFKDEIKRLRESKNFQNSIATSS